MITSLAQHAYILDIFVVIFTLQYKYFIKQNDISEESFSEACHIYNILL